MLGLLLARSQGFSVYDWCAARVLLILSGIATVSVASDSGRDAGQPRQPLPSGGTFPLEIVTTLPGFAGTFPVVGDTDHDGRREIVTSLPDAQGGCCFYSIFEHLGANSYSLEYSGAELAPTGVDDLDQDGKAEIIGQHGNFIQVYESLDASSHPTQLIWSSPPVPNTVGSFAFGDTDRDGHREIIYGIPGGGGFHIFESTGDNTFQVFTLPTGAGGTGVFVADMDRDALPEIIALKGSSTRRLKFFESLGNDAWTEVASVRTGPTPGRIAGGRDVDGNGKPDLFVGEAGTTPEGRYAYKTRVYEMVCDNQYTVTDSFQVSDGSSGFLINALGDLDGLGVEEYIVNTGTGLWVFRPVGPGDWELAGQFPDPDGGSHSSVLAADVTQNGRTDLIWPSAAGTLVLEYSSGWTDAPVFGGGLDARLSVSPNPCYGLATIHWPNPETIDATMAVFDVRGRLVQRQPLRRDSLGNGLWLAPNLNSGTYFLQLETKDRAPVAKGRVVVTHRR